MHVAQVPWLKRVFGSEALPLAWLGLPEEVQASEIAVCAGTTPTPSLRHGRLRKTARTSGIIRRCFGVARPSWSLSWVSLLGHMTCSCLRL